MKAKSLYSKVLIAVVVCILLIGAVVLFTQKTDPDGIPKGYVKVESYVHVEEGDATCLANIPSCGICEPEGKVIDKKCYVPKDSL